MSGSICRPLTFVGRWIHTDTVGVIGFVHRPMSWDSISNQSFPNSESRRSKFVTDWAWPEQASSTYFLTSLISRSLSKLRLCLWPRGLLSKAHSVSMCHLVQISPNSPSQWEEGPIPERHEWGLQLHGRLWLCHASEQPSGKSEWHTHELHDRGGNLYEILLRS